MSEFSDIWSMASDVVDTNKTAKQNIYKDIPNEDKIASNINGFVINSLGNIVAKFGFFIDTEDEDILELKISADGFLSKIYNEPTNIILGYGHPLGFTGLVDPSKSQILHLGPDVANGDDFIIRIANDETLQTQGLVILIRDTDVMMNLLRPEVQEDFKQSLKDASVEVYDLNEIEASYNNYIKHLHVVLGEEFNDTTEIEEIYE